MHDVIGEAAHLVARVAQAVTDPTISATSGQPAETTQAREENRDRNNNSSSPLLFFVALGFGVVFTNLW